MPKSKEAIEKIKKEKQEAILSSAIEVFAKKGYAATNIEDIAQNAQVSVGLIYRYFSSKESLYNQLVDIAIDGLKEITRIMEASLDPKKTIEEVIIMMIKEFDNKEFINLNLMMTQSTIIAGAPRYNEILEYDKKMFEATAMVIKKGQEEGFFTLGDPLQKSVYLFSSIMGTVITRAIYNNNYQAPHLDDIVAFLRRK